MREARHLQEEFSLLRGKLLEMAGVAEELLRAAVEALVERDIEKAKSVIRGDRELDAMELELDDLCINILALHQPVARDLRFITMAMRISNDLERVGDHSVNIAHQARDLAGMPGFGRSAELEEMARVSGEMLSDALDSFVRSDAGSAREVCRRDDVVDALEDTLFRVLLTHMMEDPRRIGSGIALILTARNFERVADLATNIAEDVVFLVEGRSIKHGARKGEATEDHPAENGDKSP
ncbi:MAG: phosphate signaling complex protein PhoU [Gemmatimonadota bacterium]